MILITGGGGFVGFNIARCLVDRGEEVLLVDNRPIQARSLLAPFWNNQIKEATGELLDLPFLLSTVKKYSVESIIHTAAIFGPGWSLYQILKVQIEGSTNVLEVGRIFGLRQVTFISSVDTYRGWPDEPEVWREDAYLPPVSFSQIGNSKKAVEQLCLLYSKEYGLSVVSLRLGRLYGPGAAHASPIKTMVENAVAGKPTVLSNVPANSRSHTVYAKDAGEGTSLVHLAKSPKHYIYNVSDGGNPTMLEVAQAISEVIPDAKIQLGPAEEGKFPYSGVDIERIKTEMGFTPRDIKQGIMAYINWLKEGKY